MKDFFLILIGGICSALGGCIAIWYQAKKARQIKMEEVRGEQQLEACKKALYMISHIQSILLESPIYVLKFLNENDEWLSTNQLFLPHTFVENWRSIQEEQRKLKRKYEIIEKTSNGARQDKLWDEANQMVDFVRQLAKEAEEILRKELGLKEVKIKRLDKEKG